ncbi:hypothetical protein BC830DRAFT_1109847 [Chytriomyces sp. MP71]|nr:hypothetical protein BC830DRAFT_1109847 [Chytriomyces sp. MP71]
MRVRFKPGGKDNFGNSMASAIHLPALPNGPNQIVAIKATGTVSPQKSRSKNGSKEALSKNLAGSKTAVKLGAIDYNDPNALSTKGLPFSHILDLVDSWGGRLKLNGKTTTEVSVEFLQPMTKDKGLSLCAQYITSADQKLQTIPKDAFWFVSHAWKFVFLDVIDALSTFLIDQKADFSTSVIWLDLFSNSQHNTGLKPFQWWETTFLNAVESIGNVVMVLQPWLNPIPLTRAWCIFEVYACSTTGSKFHLALSPNERDTFMRELKTNPRRFYDILARTSCDKSEAFKLSDKEAIFNIIRNTVGFNRLNRMVFDTFAAWIVEQLLIGTTKSIDEEDACDWKWALAGFYELQGKYEAAEKLLLECQSTQTRILGRTHPSTMNTINSLAVVYRLEGRAGEAEKLFLECLETRRKTLGDRHVETLTTVNNLALLYKSVGRFNDAEPLYVRCLEAQKAQMGDYHTDTLSTMSNLGVLYVTKYCYGEAEPLLFDCLAGRMKLLGSEHPDTLSASNNLALLYKAQERLSEAEALYLQCLSIQKKLLGPDHQDTLISESNLAGLYVSDARFSEADSLYQHCIRIRSAELGESSPETLASVGAFATSLLAQERFGEAEPLLSQCLKGLKKQVGEEHPDTIATLTNLANVYDSQGRYAEAELLLLQAVDLNKKTLGNLHPTYLSSLNALGGVCESMDKLEVAERHYADCLAIQRTVLGGEHPDTILTMYNLASLFKAQGSMQKAQPLFDECFRACKKVLGKNHPHTLLVQKSMKGTDATQKSEGAKRVKGKGQGKTNKKGK